MRRGRNCSFISFLSNRVDLLGKVARPLEEWSWEREESSSARKLWILKAASGRDQFQQQSWLYIRRNETTTDRWPVLLGIMRSIRTSKELSSFIPHSSLIQTGKIHFAIRPFDLFGILRKWLRRKQCLQFPLLPPSLGPVSVPVWLPLGPATDHCLGKASPTS